MYTINPTNSLYFFPHKLTFTPLQRATDNEKRNRWFPGSDASVVLSRVRPQGRQAQPARLDVDPHRMDDDGARYLETETSDR